MSGRQLTVAVALVAVVALPVLAEDAKPRGSGGGSSGGSGHASHSGGSGGGSSSQGSSGSGYHPSGGSGSSHGSPTLTDAQRRHPRAGTGTGYRYPGYGYGYGHGGYYGGGYYGGYPYYPYYRPYYWGYGSYPWGGLYFDSYWYGGGAAPYYSSSYGYGDYSSPDGDDSGMIRLLVDQEKAKVYVDGYYAGVVDDFDGLWQRLYVSAGRHEIAIKLDGYKTERFEVYVQDGSTVKIKHDMTRGEGEQRNMEYAPIARNQEPAEREAPRDDRYAPADDRYAPNPTQRQPSDAQGTLRLDVRPEDASIYVDGAFSGSARDLRQLPLSTGRHRIEIVRPGFRTYDRDVEVDLGRDLDLSVELEK